MYKHNSAPRFNHSLTLPSRSQKRRRRTLGRICCSISAFAALFVFVFLFQPGNFSARSGKTTAKPKDRPEQCSSCTQVGEQKIYAPLIELPESQSTELNLNCRSPHEMIVTPVFYTKKGDAFTGAAFPMQAAEVKTVDLKTLMPRNIRNRRDWGGMALSYTGTSLEMWGQLRLLHVSRGGSADITFVNLPDRRSDTRNAVWWMPAEGEAIIALGNLAGSPAKAELQFSNGDHLLVEVPAFGTEFVRRRYDGSGRTRSEKEPQAVTITANGAPGSVIPAGVVSSPDGSFTSAIRFYDTQNAVQPNLYSTRFRLANVKPRMLLRNTGAKTISATPRFLPVGDDPTTFIDLPALTIKPNEVVDVDLQPLESAVQGISKYDAVSIQVLNSGEPGSLIGALNGTDTVTGMTYDVPLRDSGGVRISTGAYPWRLDHDVSTIASVTNISPVPSGIVVQINYPGGPYLLDPRRLAPGETAVYDLRKIRDEQIPDRNGHTIPRSTAGGQFRWFIHGAGSGRLIGRAEMLSESQEISSSYSCNDPCPPVFGDAWLDPNIPIVLVGNETGQTVWEMDYDSYGNHYGPMSPWVVGWYCSDTNVASMEDYGTYAEFTGVSPGFTNTSATVQYERYVWDGLNCYDFGPNQAEANGGVNVGTLSVANVSAAPTTMDQAHDVTFSATLAASSGISTTTGTTIEVGITGQNGDFTLSFSPAGQVPVNMAGGESQTYTWTVHLTHKPTSTAHCTLTAHVNPASGITVVGNDSASSQITILSQ